MISVWSREVFNELSLERVEGEIFFDELCPVEAGTLPIEPGARGFFNDLKLVDETYDLHLSMAGEGAEGIRFIDVSDEA